MKKALLFWFVLFFAAVLRYHSPLQAEEELIVPDGIEYAVGGLELLDGKIPLLRMEGGVYPPHIFFGYPLLIVPFYILFGRQMGCAVFASLFFGISSLALCYLISKKIFGTIAALFTLIILSLSPLHHYLSTTILSDLAFLTFILLAVFFRFDKAISPRLGFILGALIGFSIWIRYPGFVLIPIFILDFLIDQRTTGPGKLKCVGMFLLSVFLWLVPMGVYHQILFGNLFKTGYHFWKPHWWGHLGKAYSWKYAFVKPGFGGHEGNAVHYLKILLGWNRGIFLSAYPFFVFLFFILAVLKIRKNSLYAQRRFLFFTLIFMSIFGIILLPHFAQSNRFLMPVLFLVLILSGEGFRFLLQRLKGREKIFLGILSFFYLLHMTSALSNSNFHQTFFQKRDLVLLLNEINEKRSIITGLDPVSFEYYFGKKNKFRYFPVSNSVEYIRRRITSIRNFKAPFQDLGPIPETYLHRVEKGEVFYLENLARFYRKEYKKLWRHCHVVQDRKRGSITLYRFSRIDAS